MEATMFASPSMPIRRRRLGIEAREVALVALWKRWTRSGAGRGIHARGQRHRGNDRRNPRKNLHLGQRYMRSSRRRRQVLSASFRLPESVSVFDELPRARMMAVS
jgi:hypothetical protein